MNLMTRVPTRCLRSVSFSAVTSEAPPRASKAATRWTAVPGEVIDGGEIVVLAIKPSMWRPLFDSAPWMVTCCLLVAVLTWLGRPIPGWSPTVTAQVILLIALARVAVAVVRWVPTWYVLTNRRIINIHGVRSPRISSRPLIGIRNTHLQRSPMETLTHLGTIIFVADHKDDVPWVWQSVANVDEVHAKVRRAIENAADQRRI